MLIRNRKAYYNYEILESFTSGIKLIGSEVKSIKDNRCNIDDAYVVLSNGGLIIKNMRVSPWKNSHYEHEENRDRVILLNKSEISKISKWLKNNGITIVPTSLWTTKTGLIKLNISVARGKKIHDKRESIRERDLLRATE